MQDIADMLGSLGNVDVRVYFSSHGGKRSVALVERENAIDRGSLKSRFACVYRIPAKGIVSLLTAPRENGGRWWSSRS